MRNRVRKKRRFISGERELNKRASSSDQFDRHLNQVLWTTDGNFQLNRFKKNSDPDDVSLCQGRAYFPLESSLQEYLVLVPNTKGPFIHMFPYTRGQITFTDPLEKGMGPCRLRYISRP